MEGVVSGEIIFDLSQEVYDWLSGCPHLVANVRRVAFRLIGAQLFLLLLFPVDFRFYFSSGVTDADYRRSLPQVVDLPHSNLH